MQGFIGKKFELNFFRFDPTANGLHVGNLIILQTLKLFQKKNFEIFTLVGK